MCRAPNSLDRAGSIETDQTSAKEALRLCLSAGRTLRGYVLHASTAYAMSKCFVQQPACAAYGADHLNRPAGEASP
jgi:hypothetical protein